MRHPLLEEYFSNALVKAALKIPKTVLNNWASCSNGTYNFSSNGSIGLYPQVLGNYKILHYNGNNAMLVSTWSAQQWLSSLNLNITKEWSPITQSGKTIGFVEGRSSQLTFATILEAGDVPAFDRPAETSKIISSWIQGTLF